MQRKSYPGPFLHACRNGREAIQTEQRPEKLNYGSIIYLVKMIAGVIGLLTACMLI